jgi:DNA-binding phage protein
MRVLEIKDVIQLLRSEVERAGSQAAFARKAGVDRATVHKTLNGQVRPAKKVIDALDLHIVFVPNRPWR